MSPSSNSESIVITGKGAVSPAGWGAADLIDRAMKGTVLPYEELTREDCNHSVKVRRVAKAENRHPFLRHPRLRRAGVLSRYVAAAGLEALGETRATAVRDGKLRLGIIVVFATGCVAYTRRFYEEVLDNPSLASPIVFPETVFNAPASHLAAMLGSTGINYTLLGDAAEYLSGLKLASDWLYTRQCDGCLVIGAEEIDWLISEAVHLFSPAAILAEGAGALYLERGHATASNAPNTVQLSQITHPVLYTNANDRKLAAAKTREQLEIDPADEKQMLLLDGLQKLEKLDAAETAAWENWQGQRLSIRKSLGDALGSSIAWQCVSAVSLLEKNYQQCHSALVSAVGLNQQSIAARFTRSS